jgi:CubicO group peptidase (beta-lactamase class C family)
MPPMQRVVERGPLVLVLALCGSLVACSDGPTTPPVAQTVASVQVSGPTSLQLGESVTLTATARDASGNIVTGRTFTWSSSDDQRASVNSAGRVTAHATGDVTITAEVDGRSGSAALQVVPQLARITAILDSLRAVHDMPALGGAIITRDSVWAFDAVGRRRASTQTPVTNADQFHLGSNLKAMTGALVGRLVDEGLLHWDLRLDEALPDLAAGMRAEYRDRTLADVLAHAARLQRDPTGLVYTSQDAPAQRLQAVTWALSQPPAAGAGVYAYSNIGYMVAGLIVERVADQPFEALIVDRLFTPLGITSAGFGAMGTPGMEDQPWQHYINTSNQRVEVAPAPNADNPPSYGPAGRAHMSVPDWARFIQAVLRAEDGDSDVWSQATALKLTTPHVFTGADGYAMGWLTTTRSWAGGRVLAHSGTNTMNYSAAWLAPDAGFGVIVVTNQGGNRAAQATDQAASRLIGLFLNGN